MSDEIIGGYAAQTHDELYRAVMAGDPDQVDEVATVWRSLQGAVEQLGAALATDLSALQQMWEGEAGAEFQRRAGLISGYCADLGRDFDALHQGLTLMAGALRETRAAAEEPATPASDPAALIADAATIGAAFGVQQDDKEAAKSRERMVRLVTDLALTYTLTGADRWPGTVPQSPPDLPGSASTVAAGAATAGAPAAAPAESTGTPTGTGLASGGGLSASSAPPAGLFDGPSSTTRTAGGWSGGAAGAGVSAVLGGAPAAGRSASRRDESHRAATGVTGMGSGPAGDPDGHDTWLMEDDLAWGGGDDTAPAVLGGVSDQPDEFA